MRGEEKAGTGKDGEKQRERVKKGGESRMGEGEIRWTRGWPRGIENKAKRRTKKRTNGRKRERIRIAVNE